jgi:hypothetical protein
MSIWQEILNAAAAGDDYNVERDLNLRLPLSLRYPRERAHPDAPSFDGPVSKAIQHFVRGLTQEERPMAESRIDEIIDSVTDEILAKVKRTADVVLFCTHNPELDCAQIAVRFDWSDLKRSQEVRIQWIKEHLTSMIKQGVPLSINSRAVAESAELVLDNYFGFDERALVKGWDINKSWIRFKKHNEVGGAYRWLNVDGGEEGIAHEGIDFGLVPESKLIPIPPVPEGQMDLEFRELAVEITAELDSILNDLDRQKPTAGYPPIAWHNVWWHFAEMFSALHLNLRLDDPCCETDQLLAERISQNYAGYVGINRLKVQRRRTRLTDNCQATVIPLALAYYGL